MREIKFRAWAPNCLEMWNWERMQCVLNHIGWENFSNGEKVVMQFTGLRDKNGKEIYEGDICSHKYYSSPVVCRFVAGEFVFDDVSRFDTSLEVIGNIYENPELLST